MGSARSEFKLIHNAPRTEKLPIYAASEIAAGVFSLSDEAIDFIVRPDPLLHVQGGYGILVVDDLMTPEFDTGDIVLINPHLPPIPNSTYLFYSIADGKMIGRFHRLLKISPDQWTVETWHPDKDVEQLNKLERGVWRNCHKVVGRFCRR